MYARVSTFEGPPGRLDDMTGHAREYVLPRLRQLDGFEGFVVLHDRSSGKLLSVTLWEGEEALRASDEAAARLRGESTETVGGTVAGVEEYEVALFEAPS